MVLVILCEQFNGERLLLIGDSFDRDFVAETCNHYKSVGEVVDAREWGQEIFKEFFGGVSTWMCRSSGTSDELYYVRVLGSLATGPYYQHYKFSSRHKYVDTPVKIRKTFQLFQQTVGGYPDRVFFNSAAWCMITQTPCTYITE